MFGRACRRRGRGLRRWEGSWRDVSEEEGIEDGMVT
jgi:hypothetical protein